MKNIKEYKWGSHIPVLQTIMDIFNPNNILELGMGRYSTPLLYQYNKQLTSIETNLNWFQTVKHTLKEGGNFKPIYHDINLHTYTKFNEISKDTKQECINFYKSFIPSNLDLLFVDHISGLRSNTILSLLRRFKFIVYHDAEQIDKYNYSSLSKENTKDYIHIINKTPIVHTGILIHKNYISNINMFIKLLHQNNSQFCSFYDIQYKENA